jgi:hypothetical protein
VCNQQNKTLSNKPQIDKDPSKPVELTVDGAVVVNASDVAKLLDTSVKLDVVDLQSVDCGDIKPVSVTLVKVSEVKNEVGVVTGVVSVVLKLADVVLELGEELELVDIGVGTSVSVTPVDSESVVVSVVNAVGDVVVPVTSVLRADVEDSVVSRLVIEESVIIEDDEVAEKGSKR